APALRRLMELPEEPVESYLATHCGDDRFDCDLLRAIAEPTRCWGTATGSGVADKVDGWLAMSAAERSATLPDLALVVFTGAGDLRKVQAGLLRTAPGAEAHAARLAEEVGTLLRIQRGAQLAGAMAAGLRAGQAFAA